jgi:Raf kinase inhibitor-like YbhB/YbcL family protein
VLVGCGGGSGATLPSTTASVEIRLAAPFPDGGRIPARYTCEGEDRAPEIHWSGATGQGSLVLVMTDRDAHEFVHWLVYDFAGRSGVVGGSEDVGTAGRNSFGGNGYRGPCPPHGDRLHHYVITMYEFAPFPSPMTGGESADEVVRDDPIAQGSITGVFAVDPPTR